MSWGKGLAALVASICLLAVLIVALGIQRGSEDADGSEDPGSVPTIASQTISPELIATVPLASAPIEIPSATPIVDAEPAVLESIAHAETEGTRWPEAPLPERLPAGFEDVAGSSERICVDVQAETSQNGAWRSGEFLAGHFGRYREERANNPDYDKLWWKPLHNSPEHLSGVMVRAVRLEGPGEPIPMEIFTFEDLAWPAPPPDVTPTPAPEGAHPDYFYPSGLELPALGRWMLVATMGPDWGCFIMELSD